MTTGMIHIYSIGNLRIFILSYTQTRGETPLPPPPHSERRYYGNPAALLRNFSRVTAEFFPHHNPFGNAPKPFPTKKHTGGMARHEDFFLLLRTHRPPPGGDFYVKFVKGETDYKLAVYDFRYFLPEYEERGSSVWEQRLNLNPQEKRRLIEALMVNYRPENRVYRYNFVFDNCSTRPRDKIEEAVDGQVRYVGGQAEARPLTFRQWIARYVGADTWLMLGIDMIFGLESDRPASLRQSMFLPEVLMRQVSDARIVSDGAPERPLAQPAVTLVRGGSGPLLTDGCGWLKPLPVMWLLVVLAGLSTALARRRGGGWRLGLCVFDTGLFAAAGLVGCVIFFLDFVSLHPLVGDNLNVLLAQPAAPAVGRRRVAAGPAPSPPGAGRRAAALHGGGVHILYNMRAKPQRGFRAPVDGAVPAGGGRGVSRRRSGLTRIFARGCPAGYFTLRQNVVLLHPVNGQLPALLP